MNNIEIFLKVLEDERILDSAVLRDLFSIPGKNNKTDFLMVKDDTIHIKINKDDTDYTRTDLPLNRPILKTDDVFELDNKYFPNMLDKPIKTTVGLAITNYILILKPLHGKIKYINKQFTIDHLESKYISKMLSDNYTKDEIDKVITIEEYKHLSIALRYLENLSHYVTASMSVKTLTPFKELDDLRVKLIKEYKDKYGEDVFEDYTMIAKLETDLKNAYKEKIKDDPAYDKLIAGKVLNVALKDMYLIKGADPGFTPAAKAVLLDTPLTHGLGRNKDQITASFNKLRFGSYSRGAEVQKGGVTAKVMLRAINAISIVEDDCGTKDTKTVLITNDNYNTYVGRYILENGKLKLLKDENSVKEYVGKQVLMRSPQRCKTKDNNLCKVCVGEMLSKNPDGIALAATDISSVILNTSMKAMHGKTLTTAILDLEDIIRL